MFRFLPLLFLFGCASYTVPAVTDNHPACPHVEVAQIQLSSVLDLDD